MTGHDQTAEPFVRAESLGMRFGRAEIVSDVNLAVYAGDEIALTGRSGSGKTTILLALSGLLRPTTGQVSWPGLGSRPGIRRSEIGMVFQAPSLMPELTAIENVTLPLRLRGVNRPEAHVDAVTALTAAGVLEMADALPTQLSGGQQQRVAIARALAGRHKLLLADEPTGALDSDSVDSVLELLHKIRHDRGITIAMVTHDASVAAAADRIIRMSDGKLETPMQAEQP
jgi:putative ABC transport system ATP-binding protein